MQKSKKRNIVIGDVHGCLNELNELIEKLNYNAEEDRLILLGDLIDRGNDSVGVIRRARELNLECIMGNHELKFLKWHRSGRNPSSRSQDFYPDLNSEDILYIENMLPYLQLEDETVLVHAGLRPGILLENQSEDDLFFIRFLDANQDFISLRKLIKVGKEAANAKFWTHFWKGPHSIVYGHNVHSFEDPLIEEVAPGIICYGIDTGCCFGGRLSALIMENKEIVQVQAKKVYFPSGYTLI